MTFLRCVAAAGWPASWSAPARRARPPDYCGMSPVLDDDYKEDGDVRRRGTCRPVRCSVWPCFRGCFFVFLSFARGCFWFRPPGCGLRSTVACTALLARCLCCSWACHCFLLLWLEAAPPLPVLTADERLRRRREIRQGMARIWDFRNPQTGALYEIDFVLVDSQGGTIEGLIPAGRADQFKGQLKEGSIYTIERFNIYDAKKTYKSVDHPYRICFTQRTLATEVLPHPDNFPRFAYNTFPFSVLAARTDENVLISDVVGLIREVTEVSPASGPNKQQKRNIYITDGKEQSIVTLWGQLANNFDAEGLLEASAEEPIIVLFVGMTVGQFSGMLAFKSTSVTRWYINIPINEVATIRESTETLHHQIEWHGSGQNRHDPIETTVANIADLEPNDIMGERYTMKIHVTEIVSTNDWWYMGCKDCWKFRIVLNAVDVDVVDPATAPMAEFTFFGPHGETIVGKEAVMIVANARGQANYIPPELAGLVGQKFTVTVTPSDKSLDADYKYYQVQAVEPLQEEQSSEQPFAAEAVDQPSGSNSTPARTTSSATATPPPSVHTATPPHVLSTPQSTEKSVTTKDTDNRGAQQPKQEKLKKGRTMKELEYPSEE